MGIAVSGGPDSIALLLLAHATFPGEIEAATVDHRLRAASASEAEFVAAICAKRGIPHATLAPETPIIGNIQSSARTARYALLADWAAAQGLGWIATAHHADDQMETLLMRLNRGSGIAGLAGVRARNGQVIRPLLTWRRHELAALVANEGIIAIDDPSNRDDRFDRARMRKSLAEAQWLDPISASRSASALADAEAALAWTATAYEARRVAIRDNIVSLDPRGLPAELLRRLVLACLRHVTPDAKPRGDELDRLIVGLSGARTATLAGVKCTGGDFWLFSAAPPRR